MPGAPDERIRFEAFGPSGIRRPRIAIAIAIAIAPEKFGSSQKTVEPWRTIA
ncbi:hypothetical protein [Burkholderia pseudomallei]|uniref:hypothetical protein n=1 Tax=Burkholderia pseudomallei TaxID=28450 RepID=UPI0012F4CE48|nr:hypothetical protein [Burkholderia pseudomallei]